MTRKHYLHRSILACLWIAILLFPAVCQGVRAESDSGSVSAPGSAEVSAPGSVSAPSSAEVSAPGSGSASGSTAKTISDAEMEAFSTAQSEPAAAADPNSELAAETSEDDASGIDFVLVLDGSGTMAKSDPKGLTVEAAKMFVDMLPNKNARIAVVEFGPDYGESAYDAEKYTKYVSVPFPLCDITSIEQKEACKEVIEQTRQDGDYTPVGYAFQAACDVLEKGGATPENAGILLLSDFRVTGQRKEDFREDGYSYQSLEDAEQTARINQWPVYTLEMNFDGKNDNPSHYTERIARRIRTTIPEKTGYGEYIPLKKASDAHEKFAEIFDLFFDPNREEDAGTQSQITDSNGDATFPFSVGDMVAELNITLTCADTAKIKSVEIGRGDQMTAYDMETYDVPLQREDLIVTREDRHITCKLMLPPPGEDWKLIVHGEPDTEIGMYALSIHDMNLILRVEPVQKEAILENTGSGPERKKEAAQGNAETEPEQEEDLSQTEAEKAEEEQDLTDFVTVNAGAPAAVTASYVYDGKPYTPERVYAAYPAVLEILETGEKIPMKAKGSEYRVNIAFRNEGTFTVKVTASGDSLRTGSIETGTCRITVQEAVAAPEEKTETEERVETETETETETEAATERATEKKAKPAPQAVTPPPAPRPPKQSPPWYTDTMTLVMIGAAVLVVLLLIFVIRRRSRKG